MATRTWNGVTDAWSTASNWTGSAVPVDGDLVIIPATNSQAIQTGLDQNGVELVGLYIEAGYTPNIGSSGNHLIIHTDKLEHHGSGSLFFTLVGAPTTDDNFDHVIIDSNNLTNAATITAQTSTRSRLFEITKGKVDFTTASVFDTATKIACSYRSNPSTDVNLTIPAGAGTVTDLFMDGGYCEAHPLISNLHARSGVLKKKTTTCTKIHQTGGLINYELTGTIAELNGLAGTFDATRTLDIKTITQANLFPNHRLVGINNTTLVVITQRRTFSQWTGGTQGVPFP
jgi:hypothetical protein